MSWAVVGVSIAAIGVGTGIYSAVSAPGAPGAPDMAAASRAGIEADAATLAERRRLEAAAQQGGTATYRVRAHNEKKVFAVVPTGEKNYYGFQPFKLVPYVASEWEAGGKYHHLGKPELKTKTVRVKAHDKTVDFTGFGEADVQGAVARKNAENILELQKKYGSQFIEESLKQQKLADPEGTAAREKLYHLIQQQAEAEPDRPVAELLDAQVGEQLAAGKGLDRISKDVLDEAVARAQAARGDSGSARFDEPLTTGFEGQRRLDAAQQKALGWLTSGATPEDVEYRREQQDLANLAAFTAGQTPQSQFQNLSGAQAGPAPFYPGNRLPTPNANAGAAMQQTQLQGWNTRMTAAANQADPWMAGISLALQGLGTAGAGGWKPLAKAT